MRRILSRFCGLITFCKLTCANLLHIKDFKQYVLYFMICLAFWIPAYYLIITTYRKFSVVTSNFRPLNSRIETEIHTGLYDMAKLEELRKDIDHVFPKTKQYVVDYEKNTAPETVQMSRLTNLRAFCQQLKSGEISIDRNLYGQFSRSEDKNSVCVQKLKVQNEKHDSSDKTEQNLNLLFVTDPLQFAIKSFFSEVLIREDLGMPRFTLSDILTHVYNRSTRDGLFPGQVELCNPCDQNMEFMGRYESFEEDLNFLSSPIYLNKFDNHDIYFQEQLLIKSSEAMQKANDYLEDLDVNQINEDLARKIIWIYRFDYLAFGYNPYSVLNKTKSMEFNNVGNAE